MCLETSATLCQPQPQCGSRTICRRCLVDYVAFTVDSAYSGLCPTLYCPLCHGKDRHVLSLKWLSGIVGQDYIVKYENLASILLSLQCSACHSRKSVSIQVTDAVRTAAMSKFQHVLDTFADFVRDISYFETGAIDVEIFYNILCENHFPVIISSSSDSVAWETMKTVLECVLNPERRANLQLRYFRSRPRVWTSCCHRQMCFRCRTREYHEGKSCSVALSGDIVSCSGCGVSIVKGDGCNLITCVCGFTFNFATQLSNVRAAHLFHEAFPHDTAMICVSSQCGSLSGESFDLKQALAWESIHKEECTRAYMLWWKQQFPCCPTQCAVVIDSGRTHYNELGLDKARKAWIKFHPVETERCRSQLNSARFLIFSSLYLEESERLCAAMRWTSTVALEHDGMTRGLSSGQLTDIYSTAKMFLEATPNWKIFKTESSAKQFLILFGLRRVVLHACSPGKDISTYSSNHENVFTGFLASITLNVGSLVKRTDNSLLSSNGRVLVSHGDGTYDVQWGIDGPVQRVHRAGLRFVSRGLILKPCLDMSDQQYKTFEAYITLLRILCSEEGNDIRSREGLVEFYEHHCGGVNEAAIEVAKLQPMVALLLDQNCRSKLQEGEILCYECRWTDVYYACAWMGGNLEALQRA